MKVTSILEEQFKDLISEDTLKAIEGAFEEAVNEKAEEKVSNEKQKFEEHLSLQVEAVKNRLDEEYTDKLKVLIEKLDKDHAEKLQTVIEKIDEDHSQKIVKLLEAIDVDHAVKLQKLVKNIDVKHTGMLKQIVEKYETQLNDEAKGFQERLIEEVSNYIDLYIDKTIPKNQIAEAVDNIKAQKQVAEIRKIVGISEEFVEGEIKEALVDGKKTIDSLRDELNGVLKENVKINHELKKAQAKILLDEKTSDMTDSKKNFVNKLLKNKDPQYIAENFQYVVDMFEKESEQEVEQAQEEVLTESFVAASVDVPKEQEQTEQQEEILEENFTLTNEIERDGSSTGGDVSGYLNEMKKLGKFSR